MAKTFTREELEDIWLNKPHGYFQSMFKKYKGKKRYLVTIKAYKHVEFDSETFEVWAKSANDAVNQNTYDKQALIKRRNEINAWAENVVFKYSCKEL